MKLTSDVHIILANIAVKLYGEIIDWSTFAVSYCKKIKQAVLRSTTNPAPAANYATDLLLLTPVLCCHLANATDSELWPVITNNLTFNPPTGLPELTQN